MQRPFPAQARRVLPRGITLAQLAITAALIAQPRLALAGQGGSNNSQGSGAGSKNESEMTTLVLGVATIFTAAGATYGSYRLSSKAEPAGKVAEIYLRRHAVALRQDFSLGRGPQLSELVAALPLAPAQRPAYLKDLLAHRRELLGWAEPAKLSPARALRFFEIVTELLPRPAAAKS